MDVMCKRCGTLMYGPGDENGRCNTCSKLVAAMMADVSNTTVTTAAAVAEPDSRTADAFLQNAIDLLRERGKQYDQPSGERSMGKTVAAFNAITGRDLSEAEGWLLMLLLKQVRQWQTCEYHKDSAEDSVSYSALLAEALESGNGKCNPGWQAVREAVTKHLDEWDAMHKQYEGGEGKC